MPTFDTRSAQAAEVARTPITGTAGCCARAASGQAAAPPSPAMNSRRRRQILICPSRGLAAAAHRDMHDCRAPAAACGGGLEPDSISDNYGGSPCACSIHAIGERLCRCFNSAQSRNLRHAVTPSASKLAAKHCLSGSPRRFSWASLAFARPTSGNACPATADARRACGWRSRPRTRQRPAGGSRYVAFASATRKTPRGSRPASAPIQRLADRLPQSMIHKRVEFSRGGLSVEPLPPARREGVCPGE
jgi:hypothetical protein